MMQSTLFGTVFVQANNVKLALQSLYREIYHAAHIVLQNISKSTCLWDTKYQLDLQKKNEEYLLFKIE